MTDVLDLHANIPPLHLEIDKHCHRAATCIATLPPAHPLHKPVKKCTSRTIVKRHLSPLYKLMKTYSTQPSSIECIRPAPHNLAMVHKRPFMVSITEDKEASILEDSRAAEQVKVYTDGSVQDGKVGAVAIIKREGVLTQTLSYHLGPSSLHTVHEVEPIGILLGLHLIKTDKRGRTSYTISVDNQAAISALTAVKSSPGQYIADAILKTVAKIKKARSSGNYSLKFRWTAGHVGIQGNEEVDIEAKKVAEGRTLDKKELPPLLCKQIKDNKSALRQHKKEQLKKRWASETEWKVFPQFNKINNIDSSLPSKKFIELISDDRLSRLDVSHLAQLRAGHFPVNTYLERIGKADSTCCPVCGHPREDIKHFLLDCPSYVHERVC